MKVWSQKPCAALANHVDSFGFREARLGALEVYRPLPSRSDCFLEFYFADRYRIVTVASGAVHVAPRAVLVGPHTRRREDLLLSGRLSVFSIRFSPVGFRALFGIPPGEIRDFAGEAELVLGAEVGELAERLADARVEDRCGLAEAFLLERFGGRELKAGLAGQVAFLLKKRHGALPIAALARGHGVSVRQMERLFVAEVGLTAKMFARLARLRLALKMGADGTNWVDVAAAAGYFDQSHMVRDFRELTGETPAAFRALERRAEALTRSADVAFVLSPGGDDG